MNSLATLYGYVKALPYAFSIRDYTNEPIREAIRDDPATYYSPGDLAYIRGVLTPKIAATENLSGEQAGYVAMLLTEAGSADPEEAFPALNGVQRFLRRVESGAQRVASILAPRLAAQAIGLDDSTFRALLTAQRRYINAAED